MKLHISFDTDDLKKALDIAHNVEPYCDMLIISSLLLQKYGIEAVKQFKQAFPRKKILADTKIVEHPKQLGILFGHAGADWVSVMAGVDNAVIHTVAMLQEANRPNVLLDLRDTHAAGQSAMEAESLGVDGLLFHQPYKEEDSLVFLDTLNMITSNTNLPVFVSANINRANLHAIKEAHPTGIIVGKSIIEADDPEQEAQYFYNEVSQ